MGTRRLERSMTLRGWFGQVIAWAVISGIAVLLAVSVVIPRVVGATPYTILTSSMEPSMPPGTLVVVKPVDPDDIGIGDVITYQIESGKPAVVTHRVVATGFNAKGEHVFTTRGDANQTDDAELVRPVQIKGERMYFVPHLGRVTTYVTSAQREAAMVVIVLSLFGYAAVMFAGAAADRARPKKEVSA